MTRKSDFASVREVAKPGAPFGRRLYFSAGQIDEICAHALEVSGCLPSEPTPIEIELFIEKHFECLVLYEEIKPGVLGFAEFDANGRVEVVGAARSLFDGGSVGERRVRSTLAHEAGHGLLHATLFAAASESHPLLDGSFDYERRRIMCRAEDLGRGNDGYDGKWWEWQANQAIGGLLLPQRLVEACVEPLLEERGALRLPELPESNRERAVRVLADTFEVNRAVASIRLAVLSPPTSQLSL